VYSCKAIYMIKSTHVNIIILALMGINPAPTQHVARLS
jgi:hypothetical protein